MNDLNGYVLFVNQQPENGTRVEVRIPIDSDIWQIKAAFRQFAVGCGYAESCVTDALGEAE